MKSSEVGPLFPEMRRSFQMLIIWKTRDSLMDVDFLTVLHLVSLAFASTVPRVIMRRICTPKMLVKFCAFWGWQRTGGQKNFKMIVVYGLQTASAAFIPSV